MNENSLYEEKRGEGAGEKKGKRERERERESARMPPVARY
jgi:hypothetical protein